MVAASRTLAASPLPLSEAPSRLMAWCRRKPGTAFLALACMGVIVYFFGFCKIFLDGTMSTAVWAWKAWNPENSQEHSVLVLPISLFLVWYHRDKLAAARKEPWNLGLAIVGLGMACYVIAARALQPRIALLALPIILIGAVGFVWGKAVARVVLFPCVFLLFLIPIGGVVQGTVSLQILVSSVCNALASVLGMKIEASGTTLRSLDGSFNFEIAEGCSGIRSLMAMMTLTALYVHFTQREWWKKGAIFAGSLIFAVIGNIGRIFTVILFAKFVSPRLAGGLYHDYSGFIFFPIAVMSMVGFAHIVNLDWPAIFDRQINGPHPMPAVDGSSDTSEKSEAGRTASPVSYDY